MVNLVQIPLELPLDRFDRLLRVTETLGSAQFAPTLVGAMHHWLGAQHINVLHMRADAPSLLLAASCYRDSRVIWRGWQRYANRLHTEDSLYKTLIDSTPCQDTVTAGHLLAEHIPSREYRDTIYRANGLGERLCALTRDAEGLPLLLNVYRQRETGYFGDAQIRTFAALSGSLMALCRGHIAMAQSVGSSGDARTRLLEHAPELTQRELEVCMRLLKGLTYAAIAVDIGIKESTVKTYRNRAFGRLNIHFKSELFALAFGAG
jgi:DNA-binding CsgD family transcriptional regulator